MEGQNMKGYRFGVEWIAINDEGASNDSVEVIEGYPSVCLLADLFDKSQAKVAQDVLKVRNKLFESEVKESMSRVLKQGIKENANH